MALAGTLLAPALPDCPSPRIPATCCALASSLPLLLRTSTLVSEGLASASTGPRACSGRRTQVGASARDCLLGPIDRQALVPEIARKQACRLSASGLSTADDAASLEIGELRGRSDLSRKTPRRIRGGLAISAEATA